MMQLNNLMRRFGANERGVAAVEFALIMPFLLTLYFGSIEASVLFTADKRVNTISATVGDLVAQWDPKDLPIPTATMTTYFAASTAIIKPYTAVGMKQVVSMVFVKTDGTTKVLWSLASGTGATARTVGLPYPPLASTSTTNQVARGGCVVAAETSYSYKPLFGQVFKTALNLSHTNYFIPRFGATAVVQPASLGTALTTTACTNGS